MKRIGTIFIFASILIGIFIVPINAAIPANPSYFFAVEGNLLSYGYGSASNCTVSYNSSNDRIELTTSGNGQECRYFIYSGPNSLSLSPGNYSFGFVYSDSVNNNVLRLIINSNGSETLETTRQEAFTLDRPSLLQVVINVPASANTSVRTINLRPYLVYSNNSIDSITSAFSSVIQSPFIAVASGFNSLSDQIIGVDNLITPFGTVLVFIVSIPLIVWGLNTLIGFVTRPFKRR